MAVQKANYIHRDYEVDGVAASGFHQVIPREERVWGTWVEGAINAGLSNGGLGYDTKANMNADLDHPAAATAWVIGDPVAANNGIYRKSGASGSGSWSKIAELPYSVVYAQNDGSGTANAVVATSSVPIVTTAYSQLISVPFTAANTGAMTLAIDGETPRPLVTNTGEPIPAGYISAGMSALVQIDSAGNYRLFSYGDAAAVQAAAEAAEAAAENWAIRAENDPVPASYGGDGSTTFSAFHWAQKSQDAAASAVSSNYVSRTILEAVASPVSGQIAYLGEPGREGKFRWSSVDLSIEVAADTLQGLYVAPSSDTTGASGAWVRVLENRTVLPEFWGAVGTAAFAEDGAITASDKTLTSATGSFSSADIGKKITVRGAGTSGASLYTTIASINSGTSIELTATAVTSVSGAEYGYGTDDSAPWKAAVASGYHINGKKGAIYYTTEAIGSPASGVMTHLHGANILVAWEQTGSVYEAAFFLDGCDNARFTKGTIHYLGRYDFGISYDGLVSGIHANDSSRLMVKEMEISGFNRCGVMVGALADGAATPYCQTPRVQDCNIHHNRVANVAYGNTADGIVHGNELTFAGIVTDDGTGYGFTGWSAYEPVNTSIIGNHANDNWRKGIDFHSGKDGVVSSNICARNRTMGIFLNGVRGNWAVTGNTISEMSWDNTFPTDYFACFSLGAQIGQGTTEIPTTFVVTGNVIRDVNVTAGSGYPFILHGTGLSYGKYIIANNSIDVQRVTNLITSSNGPSAGVAGNLYDITIEGNIFRASEVTNVPIYIRGPQNRAKIFSGNTVEITTVGTTTGVYTYDTPTVGAHSLVATNNNLIIPISLWSTIYDPISVRRAVYERAEGNIVNGSLWRDWTGGQFELNGQSGVPTTNYWTQGSRVWKSPATAGGVPGYVCVAAGTPGIWKDMAALAA